MACSGSISLTTAAPKARSSTQLVLNNRRGHRPAVSQAKAARPVNGGVSVIINQAVGDRLWSETQAIALRQVEQAGVAVKCLRGPGLKLCRSAPSAAPPTRLLEAPYHRASGPGANADINR